MRHRRSARLAIVTGLALLLVAVPAGAAMACGGSGRPERHDQPAPHHDPRRLPPRGRALRHLVQLRGEGRRRARLDRAAPGDPDRRDAGGEWTLQRLVLETQPPAPEAAFFAASAAAADSARVLFETEIDALDITVLEGGAVEVGDWATDHGFFLPPDAPEVLEFYAARSPIFLAARFNAERAAEQGLVEGEGTPIHVEIPTPNPWVPLRILGLGRQPSDTIAGRRVPAHGPRTGAPARRPPAASSSNGAKRHRTPLLTDLASDRGMGWLPTAGMWLSHLAIDAPARQLDHDLAIDASGFGQPSKVAAGLLAPPDIRPTDPTRHRMARARGARDGRVASGSPVRSCGRRGRGSTA